MQFSSFAKISFNLKIKTEMSSMLSRLDFSLFKTTGTINSFFVIVAHYAIPGQKHRIVKKNRLGLECSPSSDSKANGYIHSAASADANRDIEYHCLEMKKKSAFAFNLLKGCKCMPFNFKQFH